MSINNCKLDYEIEKYSAEIYDQSEIHQDDVNFIKQLIKDFGKLFILEPFCGSGRILIPLLEDGHVVHGLDFSQAMLDRAMEKIKKLPEKIQSNSKLLKLNVVDSKWPDNYDLVILGANCFYQLASSEEQEKLIKSAMNSLKNGGYLYIENDNMEGPLDDSWCKLDDKPREWKFPKGTCSDGTKVSCLLKTIWFDKPNRLWKAKRKTKIEKSNGNIAESDWLVYQTHPSSAIDIENWLNKYNFEILGKYSSKNGEPYYKNCGRAIFWAKSKE